MPLLGRLSQLSKWIEISIDLVRDTRNCPATSRIVQRNQLTIRSNEQYIFPMRDRLIETAIYQFGKLGFDGASTRDIAAAADTSMSNITYHFGSKEGLFHAVAESIAARLGQVVSQPPLTPLPSTAEDEERLNLIGELLGRIGRFMLSDEAAPMARFVSREQQNPASHMREYFRRDLGQVGEVVAGEIAHLRSDLSPDQCRQSFFFLLGMAVSLRSSRMSLCVMMDVDDIDPDLSDSLLDRLDAMMRGAIMGAKP